MTLSGMAAAAVGTLIIDDFIVMVERSSSASLRGGERFTIASARHGGAGGVTRPLAGSSGFDDYHFAPRSRYPATGAFFKALFADG